MLMFIRMRICLLTHMFIHMQILPCKPFITNTLRNCIHIQIQMFINMLIRTHMRICICRCENFESVFMIPVLSRSSKRQATGPWQNRSMPLCSDDAEPVSSESQYPAWHHGNRRNKRAPAAADSAGTHQITAHQFPALTYLLPPIQSARSQWLLLLSSLRSASWLLWRKVAFQFSRRIARYARTCRLDFFF